MSKKRKNLSAMERLFLHELFADPQLNPERAAVAAGYSDTVARTKAYLWLHEVSNGKQNKYFKPVLFAEYKKRLDKQFEKIDKKADDVIQEIARLGFSMISDFLEVRNGEVVLKDFDMLAAGQTAAIKEIRQKDTKEGRQIEFKLHDKPKALEMLMRHHGLFKDRVDITSMGKEIENKIFVVPSFKEEGEGEGNKGGKDD